MEPQQSPVFGPMWPSWSHMLYVDKLPRLLVLSLWLLAGIRNLHQGEDSILASAHRWALGLRHVPEAVLLGP